MALQQIGQGTGVRGFELAQPLPDPSLYRFPTRLTAPTGAFASGPVGQGTSVPLQTPTLMPGGGVVPGGTVFTNEAIQGAAGGSGVLGGGGGASPLGTASANRAAQVKAGPSPAAAAAGIGFGLAAAATQSLASLHNVEAEDAYQAQLQHWKDMGKWWFDPRSDAAPTLQEYTKGMPSRTDVLRGSTTFGGAPKGKAGAALHVADTSGRMALQGASIGSVGGGIGMAIGAIAGGLIGIVEGALGWNRAKEADAAQKKMRRQEYMAQLKAWYEERQRRRRAAVVARQGAGIQTAVAQSEVNIGKRARKRAIGQEAAVAGRRSILDLLNMGLQGHASRKEKQIRGGMIGRVAVA